MDLGKLTLWQKIILIAGFLLFINMFLPWYRWDFGAYGGGSLSINAWDGYAGFLAWFGSLCAIAAAVLIALKVFANANIKAGALKAEHLALALGALGTLFIFLRLVTRTEGLFIGTFFGLALAAGVTYAAFMAMKDEGMELSDFKDVSGPGGGGAPPPPPPPPGE